MLTLSRTLHRLRRRRVADDTGTTLVEVVVASAVSAIMLSALYVTVWGFSDDVAVASDLADVGFEARPALSTLVIELRQASPAQATATNPVVALADDRIIFTSERVAASDGPERFEYTLENCADGLCELHRRVVAADVSSSEPNYTYGDDIALADDIVLFDVADPDAGGGALFAGVSYSGGSRITTAACGTSPVCAFTSVAITLAVDPNPTRDELNHYVFTDEVRFRNVVG